MQKLFNNEIDWHSSETFYFFFYWIFTGQKEVNSDSYAIRYIERYAISFINSFEISSTGKGILKDKIKPADSLNYIRISLPEFQGRSSTLIEYYISNVLYVYCPAQSSDQDLFDF